MIIGIPKETKDGEHRVSITPAGVEDLTESGHQVLIQEGAGIGSGIPDREFEEADGKILTEGKSARLREGIKGRFPSRS